MSTVLTDPSASYAAEVARLLWPDPWEAPYVTRDRHRPGSPHRDAYLFPSARRPRLLVPVDVPASSTMLRRLGSGRGALAGPIRGLAERAVRTPAFALTRWPRLRVPGADPDADSIENHLAQCLGTPVRVGVMLGTRRVNQKPVLQVFNPDGRLLGFAKVGHNDLTASLVRREAEALTTIHAHRPSTFRAPRVLHHGRWAGLEVLVISALPVDARRPVRPDTRTVAMHEVQHMGGIVTAALATSSFWARIRHEIDLVADARLASRLSIAAAAVEEQHGDDAVQFGGWHGDWGHWNMSMGSGVLQVWDWERYDPAVPVGFDAVHFTVKAVHPGERGAKRQEQAFLRAVPATLARAGVDPDHHALTLRLYLLEMATRYVDALTHGTTPALLRRTDWVLSMLERRTDRQPAATRGPS